MDNHLLNEGELSGWQRVFFFSNVTKGIRLGQQFNNNFLKWKNSIFLIPLFFLIPDVYINH